MSKKTEHVVNISIPIEVWDDVEDLRHDKKKSREDRKLLKKDFIIELIVRGCDAARTDWFSYRWTEFNKT